MDYNLGTLNAQEILTPFSIPLHTLTHPSLPLPRWQREPSPTRVGEGHFSVPYDYRSEIKTKEEFRV